MTRSQRLQSAKHWIPTYTGKNLVRGYQNHFAVDQVCALLELRMLGKSIDDQKIENARRIAQAKAGARKNKKSEIEPFNPYPDSDEHHYFVAGYTAGGFAYGITWEQAEAEGWLSDDDAAARP
jgi:hypothetical protein